MLFRSIIIINLIIIIIIIIDDILETDLSSKLDKITLDENAHLYFALVLYYSFALRWNAEQV